MSFHENMSTGAIITVVFSLIFVYAKGDKATLFSIAGDIQANIVNPAEGPVDRYQTYGYSPVYNADLIGGDIGTPNGIQQHDGQDRNVLRDRSKLWPGGIVPYVLDADTSQRMKLVIATAMADFHAYTCITFVPRSAEKDFIRVSTKRFTGCSAWLGRWGGEQPVIVQEGPCGYKAMIIHELLHALGFDHEHNRSDRDDHITINWNRVQDNARGAFKKMDPLTENRMGFPYDYYSVMHFNSRAFSKDWRPVITTKDPTMQYVIGQRKGFSKQDLQEVNALYRCNRRTSSSGSVYLGANRSAGSCLDAQPDWCSGVFLHYGREQLCGLGKPGRQNCVKTCGLCYR